MGRMIQPKLDRTDPVKLAAPESAVHYWSDTDSDLPWTVRKYPLANLSVKHCINGVVHATPLSALTLAAFSCQSITYVCSQRGLLDTGWQLDQPVTERVMRLRF